MGGKISQTAAVDTTNKIVANVFTNIKMSCIQKTNVKQKIVVESKPTQAPGAGSIPYEENAGCKQCFTNIQDQWLGPSGFYTTWKEEIESGRVTKVPRPINLDLQQVLIEAINCGKTFCKATVATNLSQDNTVNSTVNCKAINNVRNNLSQALMGNLEQSLANNQGALGGLATALGQNTSEGLVTSLHGRIMAVLTTNVVSVMQNQINLNQTIDVTPDGGSTFNGITQQSAYNSVFTFLNKTNILDSIMSKDEWDVAQKAWNQQNTLGELGNSAVALSNSVANMINYISGKAVIAAAALVGIALVFLIGYIITMKVFHKIKKDEGRKLAIQQRQTEQGKTIDF